MEGYSLVLAKLREHHLRFSIHDHEPVFTMEDVERVLQFPKGQRIKTLAVRRKSPESYELLLFGIPSESKLDLKRAARFLGTSRSALSILSRDQIEELTGVPAGALGLVTPRHPEAVVIDESFRGVDPIYCGSGSSSHTLELHLEDLASWLPISYCPISMI